MDPKIAVILRFFPLLSRLASSAPILEARTNVAMTGQRASEHLREAHAALQSIITKNPAEFANLRQQFETTAQDFSNLVTEFVGNLTLSGLLDLPLVQMDRLRQDSTMCCQALERHVQQFFVQTSSKDFTIMIEFGKVIQAFKSMKEFFETLERLVQTIGADPNYVLAKAAYEAHVEQDWQQNSATLSSFADSLVSNPDTAANLVAGLAGIIAPAPAPAPAPVEEAPVSSENSSLSLTRMGLWTAYGIFCVGACSMYFSSP